MALGALRLVLVTVATFATLSCSPATEIATARPLPSGLPPIARAWTVADYPPAAAVLTQLPHDQLPRSAAGGEEAQLIERLTSPDALALCADRTLPIADRVAQCSPVGDAMNDILRHYASSALQDRAFADDILRIQGFLLQYAEAISALAPELMATIPRSDPTYATRLAGVEQMRRGFGQVMHGGCITVQAPNTFSETVRAAFAQKLAHAFETLEPDLPAESRSRVRSCFEHLAGDANSDVSANIRAALR